jgi:hypothetical protein
MLKKIRKMGMVFLSPTTGLLADNQDAMRTASPAAWHRKKQGRRQIVSKVCGHTGCLTFE